MDTSTYLTSNQTVTLSGAVTGSGSTAITTSLTSTSVTAAVLTGYTVGTNTSILATDSILTAFGKVQAAVSASEPALGNPSTNGYVLSSTTAGVRSWVVMTGGGGLTTVTNDVTSRTANTVYAAPNGSNGTAIFRTLVAADMGNVITAPSSTALSIGSNGTSGLINLASNGASVTISVPFTRTYATTASTSYTITTETVFTFTGSSTLTLTAPSGNNLFTGREIEITNNGTASIIFGAYTVVVG